MNKLILVALTGALATTTFVASGENVEAKSISIKTKSEVTLFEKPNASSKKIQKVEKNKSVVLMTKGKLWTKVKVGKKVGYIKSTTLNFTNYYNNVYKIAKGKTANVSKAATELEATLTKGALNEFSSSLGKFQKEKRVYNTYVSKLDLPKSKKNNLTSMIDSKYNSLVNKSNVIQRVMTKLEKGKTEINKKATYEEAKAYLEQIDSDLSKEEANFQLEGSPMPTVLKNSVNAKRDSVHTSWTEFMGKLEENLIQVYKDTIEKQTTDYWSNVEKGAYAATFTSRDTLAKQVNKYSKLINDTKQLSNEKRIEIRNKYHKPSADKARLLNKEYLIYSAYRIDFNMNLKNFQYVKAQANIQQMEEALKQGTKYRAEQKLPDLPVKMKNILNKAITMYSGYLYKAVPVNSTYALNYCKTSNIKWDTNGSIYMTNPGSSGYISFQRLLDGRKIQYSGVKITYNVSNSAVSTLGALPENARKIIVSSHPDVDNFDYIEAPFYYYSILRATPGNKTVTYPIFHSKTNMNNQYTSIELPNIKGVTYTKIELVK